MRRRMAVLSVSTAMLVSACGPNDASTSTASTSPPLTATTTQTAAALSPTTPPSRTEMWVQLDIGDCVTGLPPADLSVATVTVVDCTTPHRAEVYFRAPVTVNAAIESVANQSCGAAVPGYTGRSVENSPLAVTYLVDSNMDRTTIDPGPERAPSTVICLLENANGRPLTASVRR